MRGLSGDNAPRTEQDTGHGLVSDVCLKRKVRNYVTLAKPNDGRFGIYIREGAVLDELNAGFVGEITGNGKTKGKAEKADKTTLADARMKLMTSCYDARTFGAVMVGDTNLGTQRGPVQLSFGRSILPIIPQRHTITRMAATKEETRKDGEAKDNKTMGRKWTVSHAVYRTHGYVSANLAAKTGCTEDDLSLLWEALGNMWDHDRSAGRGEISPRALIVWKHASALGNAPAHTLFDRVAVAANVEVPTKWADYGVKVNEDAMPRGVSMSRMI